MPKAKDKPKLCFVVAPIGDEGSEARIHSDWLLEEIIKPVMAHFEDFEVRRADEIAAPGMIDTQVFEALFEAELVIADLTTLNPNVFYEIGIRHMAQKPIIHMHMKGGEKIPFDVSLYRSIEFSLATPHDLRISRDRLTAVVRAVMAPEYEVENPVTKARGRVTLEARATPEERVLLDQLSALGERVSSIERGFAEGTVGLRATEPRFPQNALLGAPKTEGNSGIAIMDILARTTRVREAVMARLQEAPDDRVHVQALGSRAVRVVASTGLADRVFLLLADGFAPGEIEIKRRIIPD